MTDDDAAVVLELHEEVRPLFRSRQFAEACAKIRTRRDAASEAGKKELASNLSGFLATCLTMDSRDEEAEAAAREGEELDPSSPQAKLITARILLHFRNAPLAARAKVDEFFEHSSPDDPERYSAWALLGTARARAGDLAGAIEVFRKMTEPPVLNALKRAEYIGVFDLTVVEELIKHRVAREECRQYLEFVSGIATERPHIRERLSMLRLAVASES
jgi:hypothetical protein